jgi:hypothetical protein
VTGWGGDFQSLGRLLRGGKTDCWKWVWLSPTQIPLSLSAFATPPSGLEPAKAAAQRQGTMGNGCKMAKEEKSLAVAGGYENRRTPWQTGGWAALALI